MTEASTKKADTRTTVRLPADTHHRAKMAATGVRKSVQDFVAEAVEEKLSRVGGGDQGAAESVPPELIAILLQNPKGAIFDSLRKSIEVAVREYRKIHKPAEEATGQRKDDHRRKTGT